jgi:hypothetical protein
MSLCQQEIEDARERIRGGGLDPDEFEFACDTIATGGPGHGAIADRIVVTRKATGKHRTYTFGLSSDWLRHLEAELRAKLFD